MAGRADAEIAAAARKFVELVRARDRGAEPEVMSLADTGVLFPDERRHWLQLVAAVERERTVIARAGGVT